VIGRYHLLLDVEWVERTACGGTQQASWSFAVQTGISNP
jgi:hypothetical protein